MVVGFTNTYATSAYHHQSCKFESHSWRGVLDATLCDKVCQWLATGRWFSLGPLVSSTNKTDRHDIESGGKHHSPNHNHKQRHIWPGKLHRSVQFFIQINLVVTRYRQLLYITNIPTPIYFTWGLYFSHETVRKVFTWGLYFSHETVRKVFTWGLYFSHETVRKVFTWGLYFSHETVRKFSHGDYTFHMRQ
jgi:hypothetical protein